MHICRRSPLPSQYSIPPTATEAVRRRRSSGYAPREEELPGPATPRSRSADRLAREWTPPTALPSRTGYDRLGTTDSADYSISG